MLPPVMVIRSSVTPAPEPCETTTATRDCVLAMTGDTTEKFSITEGTEVGATSPKIAQYSAAHDMFMLVICVPFPFNEPVKPEIGVCVTPVQSSVAPLTISKLLLEETSWVNNSLHVVMSPFPSLSGSEMLRIFNDALERAAVVLVPSALTPRTETLKK